MRWLGSRAQVIDQFQFMIIFTFFYFNSYFLTFAIPLELLDPRSAKTSSDPDPDPEPGP